MKHRCFLVFVVLIFQSCICNDNKTQTPINYTKIPRGSFGLDLRAIDKKTIKKVFDSTKTQYFSYNPYTSNNKSPLRDSVIISKSFIGNGLDKSKIIKVTYSFDNSRTGIIIGIDFDRDYYNEFLNILLTKYGPYNKTPKTICKKDDSFRFEWISQDVSDPIKMIVIDPNVVEGEHFWFGIYGKSSEVD